MLTRSQLKKIKTLQIILRIITVKTVEENFLQNLTRIFSKSKLKLQKKPVEDYDYSIILKALILSFAFSLIFVSILSLNFPSIFPTNNDKPHGDLIKDIFEEIPDAVSKLIQSHPQGYQENVGVGVGLAMEHQDSQGNLKKMSSVDSNGNLIYLVIQRSN